ncbi:MAG: tetratricopeptide repeat protein [Thaumarchaeota archaeon S15]|nr:MAG: tetratricopeptide repeat protein [Thaumarchaeota archaeon S15]
MSAALVAAMAAALLLPAAASAQGSGGNATAAGGQGTGDDPGAWVLIGIALAAAAVGGTIWNGWQLRRHVDLVEADIAARLRPVLALAKTDGDGQIGVYGDRGRPGGLRIRLVNAGQASAEEIVVRREVRLVGEGAPPLLRTRHLGALEPGESTEVRIPMPVEDLGRALGGGMAYVDAIFEYTGGGRRGLKYHVAGYKSSTFSMLFVVDDTGISARDIPAGVKKHLTEETHDADASSEAKAKRALEESEAAIGADPDNVTARRDRAAALRALGRHEEALREIELAEDACLVDARVLRERARILEGLGRPDEAIGALRRILDRKHDDLCVHRELARLHSMLGEYDNAYGAWVDIARLCPSYDVYMGMASTLMTPRRYDAAVVAFGKAIDTSLYDARAHAQKGIALTNCGKYTEAVAALRRATVLDAEMADAHAGLAYALYGLGREADAREELRLAVEAEPDNQRAHMGRGLIALEIGLAEEAAESFTAAKRLDPSMQVPQVKKGTGNAGGNGKARGVGGQ